MSAKFYLKRLLPFLVLNVILGTSSFAQGQGGVIPPPAGTPMVSGTPFQSVNQACDKYGVCSVAVTSGGGTGATQSVIPVSNATNLNGVGAGNVGWYKVGVDTVEAASTTTVINATSHGFRAGDIIVLTGGTAGNINTWSPIASVTTNTITLANALPATPAAADAFTVQRPVPLASTSASGTTNLTAVLKTTLDASDQTNYQTTLLKLEDAASASGDALVAIGGVRRDSASAQAGDGDYTTMTLNRGGAPYCDLDIQYQSNAGGATGTSPIRLEDTAFGATEAVIMSGAQAVSAIAQSVGTTGDVAPPSMDLGNRLVTTMAPAGETWQSCGTATASTADVAIKAAVASNRIYVTNITCASSDADNATNINFKDNTTVIAVGGVSQMATTSAGTFTATFPTPLRGTSNTAFNFNTAVSTSSVICCASGYISTI